MTQAEQSKLITELFTDVEKMDLVVARSHRAVHRRHAAWNIPLVVWRDGRVEHEQPLPQPPAVEGEMPWMFVL